MSTTETQTKWHPVTPDELALLREVVADALMVTGQEVVASWDGSIDMASFYSDEDERMHTRIRLREAAWAIDALGHPGEPVDPEHHQCFSTRLLEVVTILARVVQMRAHFERQDGKRHGEIEEALAEYDRAHAAFHQKRFARASFVCEELVGRLVATEVTS